MPLSSQIVQYIWNPQNCPFHDRQMRVWFDRLLERNTGYAARRAIVQSLDAFDRPLLGRRGRLVRLPPRRQPFPIRQPL